MGQNLLSDRGWSGLLAGLPDGLDLASGARGDPYRPAGQCPSLEERRPSPDGDAASTKPARALTSAKDGTHRRLTDQLRRLMTKVTVRPGEATSSWWWRGR